MNIKASEGLKIMDNYVKWGQFVVVVIAVVGILTGLFMYIMEMHSERPHKDAATTHQIETIRVEAKETRESIVQTREAVAGMSAKIDNVQKGIEEVKKLIR